MKKYFLILALVFVAAACNNSDSGSKQDNNQQQNAAPQNNQTSNNSAQSQSDAPSGWKTFTAGDSSFTLNYPANFSVDQDHDTYIVRSPDGIVYTDISRQDKNDFLQQNPGIFKAPYPHTVPLEIGGEVTYQKKTISAMGGVEGYAPTDGTSLSDVFYYLGNKYAWFISLNGVDEGHISDQGIPTPDKKIYNQILASIKISQ